MMISTRARVGGAKDSQAIWGFSSKLMLYTFTDDFLSEILYWILNTLSVSTFCIGWQLFLKCFRVSRNYSIVLGMQTCRLILRAQDTSGCPQCHYFCCNCVVTWWLCTATNPSLTKHLLPFHCSSSFNWVGDRSEVSPMNLAKPVIRGPLSAS